MNQIIQTVSIATLLMGSLNLAQAESSDGQKTKTSDSSMQSQGKMTGSSTSDHMQTMMEECMRMNRNETMCNQQMQKCSENMSAPECEKMHKSMKKSK
ncbi:MAG: hypothetical protein ACXWC9_05165 [Pseudobdellovibrionaceae bacterium]